MLSHCTTARAADGQAVGWHHVSLLRRTGHWLDTEVTEKKEARQRKEKREQRITGEKRAGNKERAKRTKGS